MNQKEYRGIAFGFSIILFWLIVLTGILIYSIIDLKEQQVSPAIISPPTLEILEVDVEPILIEE